MQTSFSSTARRWNQTLRHQIHLRLFYHKDLRLLSWTVSWSPCSLSGLNWTCHRYVHLLHDSQLLCKESSSDLFYSASNIHPEPIRPVFRWTECCGTDPTGTRNDSPSLCRLASHNRGTDQKYRHRLLRRYPLLPECGYGILSSARLLLESRLLPEMPVRFRQCKHFCHRHLPVFPVLQKLRSYRCCNKYLCCSFHIFHARYCGNFFSRLFFFCLSLSVYAHFLLFSYSEASLLRLRLLLPSYILTLFSYWMPTFPMFEANLPASAILSSFSLEISCFNPVLSELPTF